MCEINDVPKLTAYHMSATTEKTKSQNLAPAQFKKKRTIIEVHRSHSAQQPAPTNYYSVDDILGTSSRWLPLLSRVT